MLGRSIGLTDDQMGRLLDDELPADFSAAEQAIIRYARAAAAMEPITDALWSDLRAHFDERQIIEVCFIVGLDQLVSRFHALVHTDLDARTSGEVNPGTCAIPLPQRPATA